MPKSDSMPLCPFLLVCLVGKVQVVGVQAVGVLAGLFFFLLKDRFYREGGKGKEEDRAILPTKNKISTPVLASCIL